MLDTKRTTNKGKYSRVILEDGFGFRMYGVNYKSSPSPPQVDDCKQWLLTYAKKTRRPDGKRLNSYYLKHVVERAVGHYISNGALIQAAIALGFECSLIDGPNALFHIDLRLPEDDWKRVKPTGFSKFLFKHDHSQLARHSKIDPTWPRQAKRFIDLWRYLGCDGGYGGTDDELCEAWESWTGKMPPRPDLIKTRVVYNRECDFISYGDRYPVADERGTYLYALVDIDEEYDLIRVRYVGQTVSPSKRLTEHIKRPGSIDRVKWIGQMLSKDTYPQMAIIRRGVALSEADILEKAAIYAFQSCETHWDDKLEGFPPLDDALLNIDK